MLQVCAGRLGTVGVLDVPGRTYPVDIEYKPGEALVPAILDVLEAYPEGNLIAFLSGQREVEQAMRQFTAAAPAEYVALPLFGGMPPEEQARVTDWEKQGHPASTRMVAFATNVAETSLTIPGLRIVVDTGLAKEARYDAQRRITLLEQVLVSRSSANQRTGRAGRLAPGHCVRL